MADKHEKLLSDLDFRIRQLMYLCDTLKDENRNLKSLLEEKNLEIELANAKLTQLDSKYNNLKFIKTFSGSTSDDVQDAKKRLLKLVQEIDKCIALLKI